MHAVESMICLLPIVREAPNAAESLNDCTGDEIGDSSSRGRMIYSYHWSDPLRETRVIHTRKSIIDCGSTPCSRRVSPDFNRYYSKCDLD